MCMQCAGDVYPEPNDLPAPQTAQGSQDGIPDCPDRHPWERQPGETAKACLAFALHRDQGPTRSLRKTCRLTYGEQTGNLSQIKKWAKRYGWAERCRAWDDEQDRLRRLELVERRRKADDEHFRRGQELLEKGIRALEKQPENSLTPREAIACIKEAVRIQRAALGSVKEKPSAEGTTVNVHAGITVQQVLAEAKAEAEEYLRRLEQPRVVEQLPTGESAPPAVVDGARPGGKVLLAGSPDCAAV